jgi:hypothetical protein
MKLSQVPRIFGLAVRRILNQVVKEVPEKHGDGDGHSEHNHAKYGEHFKAFERANSSGYRNACDEQEKPLKRTDVEAIGDAENHGQLQVQHEVQIGTAIAEERRNKMMLHQNIL